jgi:ABC-type transport system involved in cytochrome c biogenesis permease component
MTDLATTGRSLPSPFAAVLAYTLRACLPAKRWFGVLLPCVGALLFGWLTVALDGPSQQQDFADIAELGLFALILPLTCLVIGDAVLGADVRAGTFQLTWLSPVPFRTIVLGRWLGGWLVALVTLVPALAIAALFGGVSDAAGSMALAGLFGSGAYIALFMMLGVVTRRSALWSLAVVLVGEWLLGANLSGVAQFSPRWEAQQVFAGLWDHGALLEREGMPLGWSAVVRLVVVGAVCLLVATWRLGHMRPVGVAD